MIEAFLDRRERLFGRMADIHHLTDRARQPGLTAVVARPLMGKTWTLTEVARLLEEEGRFLVGYHESKGSENSHLLYAVSNLYARWLADSSMREQVLSLWAQYKDDLVPRVGQMVGLLFEKLAGKQVPVAGAVRAAFDGLAKAQKDLQTGGLQLAPLPYDEALSLTELVAKVSEHRIVLVLDAWEKSSSLRSEFTTLESFLKHREDWPHTHIVLAVRNPELDSTKLNDEGYQRANDLCRINGAAQRYELTPIKLDDPKERERTISFVRKEIPAAEHEPEQRLLDMIDGYPGVLDFWTSAANRTTMQGEKDLRQKANDAQALRYLELEHLLAGLQDESSRTLAARLAFFPRLDSERWATFRGLLLKDQSEGIVDALVDAKVLVDERFPTYGHDTRHAAARHWFIQHGRPLIRRVAEQLIEAVASRIKEANPSELPFFEALAGCSDTARQAEISPEVCCLTDAARAALGDVEGVSHSEFDTAYQSAIRRNTSVAPLVSIALVNRGFTRQKQRSFDAAIADYTAVVTLPEAPAHPVAKALINRGYSKGLQGNPDEAIADYTAVLDLPNARAEEVADAFLYLGIGKMQQGNFDGAITDFSQILALPIMSDRNFAQALMLRAMVKMGKEDFGGSITDFTTTIALKNAPVELVAQAFASRGILRGDLDDVDGAIADYTAAIVLHDAPAGPVAQAFIRRGLAKAQQHDTDGAIADYTAAIALPEAPSDWVAEAFVHRGLAKAQHDTGAAIADYTAVMDLPGAPAKWIAKALVYRGIKKRQQGDIEGAIADYTAVIALPEAPTDALEDARKEWALTQDLLLRR